ncbi:MAG: sensor histidine kinase [Ilumatobacter sp.]|uniref:sensor histidine kinase n=1 Tax=Ilumatobacter sp. TaxID=1967498 RepID=UPI002632B277|nr:sensor histidine kinase [Ilumatobacter sp.]MDJ0768760.1 sensor histidine kinase [Ilumatobacter sp.]
MSDSRAETSSGATSEAIEGGDNVDLPSIAESEIPEVRREAREWLLRNNSSDQRAITVFAVGVAVMAIVLQAWWAAVLAGCILLVVPFRWMAGPHFGRGDLRRGILWANLGSWYLLFPLVIIIPDTLPIAMQNVIGPAILAATYLERRVVRRMVPGTIAIAVAISLISFTTDGVGLDDVGPRWLYLTVILAYVGANMWLVMGDVQELNLVHLRSLQRAVRQNRELRAADRALRDSRRRLLVAADEERIRLERDLHDGAQQRLVSLSLQLRLAAELTDEGTAPTSETLMAMHREATEAVDELRDLAQGVYPARLHEIGLARALHAVARRSPVPIEIEDTTSEEIDESTQVALYYVCVEAIQNATKHGSPDTTIEVLLASNGDGLVVTVADDGPGFDPGEHEDSRGLLNMADRVGALGGDLSIDSAPGSGTTVTARLPHLAAAAIGGTA